MKHYCLHCRKELHEDELVCPSCFHCSYIDLAGGNTTPIHGGLSAYQLECNTQWMKYKCGPNGLCGHGYAAEDANALSDMWHGKKVTLSGRDNSLSGPDRIVGGRQIQTKYYKTAKQSVRAGFGEDGLYKYNGQVLEVPADQHPDALKEMGQKIADGKVPGFTDPNDAGKIIKKGSVTYKQAKNIAKAGNIDSLLFDAKTQTVSALSSFGISFTVYLGMSLIFNCKSKEDVKNAIEQSVVNGIKNGTIALGASMATSQILRTKFGRDIATYQKLANYIYKTKAGKKMIQNIVSPASGKAATSDAAKKTTSKLLKSSSILNTIFFVVTTLPDAWRFVVSKKISGPQFLKNLVVLGGSFAAGMGGMAVGLAAGGPVGSLAMGLVGTIGGEKATKFIMDQVIKDDSEKLMPIIQVALLQLSHDYMIQTEEEFEHCMRAIASENVINQDFFYALHQCPNDFARVRFVMETLDYYFSVVVRERPKVRLSETQPMILRIINRIEKRWIWSTIVFTLIVVVLVSCIILLICIT